jgi:hypothetical protein
MTATRTQAQLRRRPVIRVFVSSTFSDLKPERNALQAQVFPRLEQLCAQNGFQFQAIDLRWGVSSEAGLDHRTMRICFDELRRAQEISPEPNFLVLLGDRYGWRPLPEAISSVEFEALKKAATTDHTDDTDKHRSEVKDQKSESRSPSVIRDIREIRGQELDPLAVLNAWYRCDENILLPEPPETDPDRIPLNFILQPRTRNLGDGRDYTRRKDDPTKDTQDWLDVQQVLWRLINTAFPGDARWFDGVDWARHLAEVNDPQHPKRAIPQLARFQASATEQEIWCGALSAANAERHVIACFREISNRDDFPIAEVKDFFDRTDSGEFDEAAVARQTALKEAIRLRLGENKPVPIPFTRLKCENGKVLVDSSEADTQAFCDAVLARFRPIIERQIEEYWNKSAKGSAERAGRELEIERDEHRRFGRERGGSESFVGRKTELEAIRGYLQNDSRLPLVLHGSSGCGKTALMARAVGEMQKSVASGQWSVNSGQKPQVIVRFIGVTPRSSDIRSLLGSLCQELRLRHPREGELPADTKALREELHEQFRSATSEQPLILFLDALDQLSDADGGRLLNWIPTGPLPANMKLVVSCLSDRAEGDPAGQPCAELKRRQLPAANFINLDVLSEDEARTLLFDRWLHQAGRTVSPDQRERTEQNLASLVCRQPIYLKLLFEEACLWRSYDAVPELGEDLPALLGQLFKRLGRRKNHGLLLVKRVIGYLTASRHGLAENEILEILFRDKEYKKALDWATKKNRHELPASATRIPIAIWSRLRFDLAPYLTERAAPGANVLKFYHRQVAEWVQEHFAKSSEHSWQPHQRLAAYFHDVADPNRECRWRGKSLHALRELPYHLVLGHMWDELVTVLNDLLFAEATCVAGAAYELVADCDMAVAAAAKQMPEDDSRSRRIQVLANAIGAEVYALNCHPQITGQQIYNRLVRLGETDAKMRRQVLRRAREVDRIACLLLDEAYRGGSQGRTLQLGVHAGAVQAVAFCPSGDWAASVSFDGRLLLYALKNRSLPPIEILLSAHLHKVCFAPRYPNVLVIDRHGKLSVVDAISRHRNEASRVAGPVEEVVVDDMSGVCHVLAGDGQIATMSFATNAVQAQTKPFKSNHPDSQCVWLVKPNGLMANECPKSLVPSIVTRPSFFIGHFRTGELYRFVDGELQAVPELRHAGGIQALAEASDGKLLVTLGHDGVLRLWSRAMGKWDRTEVELHKVRTFALGLEGQVIFGLEDGDVRLIRCTEQAQRAKRAPALFDAWLAIRQLHCEPPSQETLAFEIKSGQLIVRMGSFDKVQTLDYEVTDAVIDKHLPAIVWVTKDGHIRMAQQDQPGRFGSAQVLLRPVGVITRLFYLSGIQRIAIGREDGSIWLISSLVSQGEKPNLVCFDGHSVPISTLYELAEMRLLLSVDRRGLLCVHRLDSPKADGPCVIQPLGLLHLPSEPQSIDPIRPTGKLGLEFFVGVERMWIWHVQLGGCDIGHVRNVGEDELELPKTLESTENINKKSSQ